MTTKKPIFPLFTNAKKPRPTRGQQAEQQALDYLLKHGLQLVTRNYRCRHGELDLVMCDTNTLIIVEVRYRASTKFGGAVESVTPPKQSRIISATQHYLMHNPANKTIRFDVIAMTGETDINWIQNAFQL
jgi:putative endonuclease